MWGRGKGRTRSIPKAPAPSSLPLNPVAPLLDPGLDAVLDRNPLGFSPSSFLSGVLLWTVERCWIAATGCVDTNRGVVPSTLSSRSLFVGLVRGTRSRDGSRDRYPRGWEVIEIPSCGDLHRRSSPTLLPLHRLVSHDLKPCMQSS